MSSAITGTYAGAAVPPGGSAALLFAAGFCSGLPCVDRVVGRRLADIAAVLAVLTRARACDLVVHRDVFFALCVFASGHDVELPQQVGPKLLPVPGSPVRL